MSVLVLGEALIDVVRRDGAVAEHAGGSPLNVACGLARLGVTTTLASWWGRDERGARIEARLARCGVRIAAGSDGARRTSTATAIVDAEGHAAYTFELDAQLPETVSVQGFRHLHTGSIGAMLAPGADRVLDLLTAAHGHVGISYDLNLRPAIMGSPGPVRERVEQIVALADVVKASDEDLAWLYPGRPVADVARAWLAAGASLAVVTEGDAGSGAWIPTLPDGVRVPAAKVHVTDTVGAGDAFMAGLLARRLLVPDAGPRDVLAYAARVAAVAVQHAGAYAPTPAEVSATGSPAG